MAWLIRKTIGPVTSPITEFSPATLDVIRRQNESAVAEFSGLPADHPNFLWKGSVPVGMRRPMPRQPFEARVKELHGPLPDALTEQIVNDRIRRLVECHEPNRHQFIPTTVSLPDGSKEADWWTMQVCHRIDALAIPECEDVYEYNPKREYPELVRYRSNEDRRMKLAVKREEIAGKAIWYDYKFGRSFMSEAVGKQFIDEGLIGFCLPADEINLSTHVIEV